MCQAAAVAGDGVAGLNDPAELPDVDVHQLARLVALVTDRRLGLLTHHESRLAVAAQHRMHSRGRDTERESDRVRALAELGSLRQDRLLERSSSPSPCRTRAIHFEPVCRDQPTGSAAALIVQPAETNSTRQRC